MIRQAEWNSGYFDFCKYFASTYSTARTASSAYFTLYVFVSP